jgi:glycosyltransferase involved in cell wall biosynthesis
MQRIPAGAFDVLHYPFYYPCLWPQCPSTVTIHDLLVVEHPEWFPRPWVEATRALVRRGCKRAAGIVTGSEHVASAICSLCGVPREKIVVATYGVDRDAFFPLDRATTEAVLHRFGLSRPFLLQVGSFEPRRAVDLSIRALRAVRDQLGDTELVLVGEARYGGSMPEPIPTFVRRLGRVTDAELAGLYGAAGALLAPSHGEGFDLPVLEALACGAVVVASDIPVHVEHFQGAVELFVRGDADSLADACLRVLTDEARRAALRSGGPRHAAHFTWEECARRHVELWQRLAPSS